MPSRSEEEDRAVAAGGVALVASILANLERYSDNQELRRSIQALQRLVQDWQAAYHDLETQLALALRTNEELTNLVASLRRQLEEARGRAYAAEQRALEAEAALPRMGAERAGPNGKE